MILANKKGGILQTTFMFIMFVFVWAFWLGSFLSEWGQRYISENSPNGIEAVFYANLNLWVFLIMLAAMFLAYTFGGNN